jgi:hypothetical protein
MVLINLFGGVAVLVSYALCLMSSSTQAGDFWGGVPDGLRSLYTVNMFLAAAGYFAFTFFLMYRLKPTTRGGGRFGLGTFNALYALILIPSALWMPLTFAMLDSLGGAAVTAFAGAQAGRSREPGILLPDGDPGCAGVAGVLPGVGVTSTAWRLN